MKTFSFFAFGRLSRRIVRAPHSHSSGGRRRCASLGIERLEDRTVPSGNTISGYVFNDANNNGLFDAGESPIANNTIELLNGSGTVIASAVTDTNGFYQFATDSTISTAPTTLTETASVPNTGTNWTNTLTIAPFNPALGTLTSVDIINAGSFTSDIKVESLDNAPSTITATDSGVLTLTGPASTSIPTALSASQTFNASAFDGVIDFAGTSGHDFGPQTATGSNMVTLTSSSALQAFEGTGPISFTETAVATSSATGAGNLITQITTQAASQISVVYHYIPSNALKPGAYTIFQTSTPPGFLDGLESSNGVVIPNSVGSHKIQETLGTSNSTNNDFAELKPASVAGFVYVDANDNGVMDTGESGIANVTITLTGTNDLGPVSLTTTTSSTGAYQFGNLRPGTYVVTKTPPAGYLEGKSTLGSLGGTVGTDQFSAITENAGAAGVNYNFGELLPASLSGFVYLDANDSGVKVAGDGGISGVTVTLTGTNDLGTSIDTSETTGTNGSYSFTNLRPGTYTITETQPANYLQGTDNLGSLGGTLGTDQFSTIVVVSSAAGSNYNFGEILPPSLSGFVYVDANDNGVKDSGEAPIAGATVTLTGTNDLGAVVNTTQTTASDGSYDFTNLRPGSYTIILTQPTSYLQGKEAVGSAGGTVGNNQFSAITLGAGITGTNYDFGELSPASVSGFVYLDSNDNGVKDSGEAGIAGVTVTLTGTNDLGTAINVSQTTGSDGSYHFVALRPGTYTITKTPPSNYLDGKDALGSAGGTLGTDLFSGVSLGSGVAAVNYNFGEVLPGTLSGFVYLDSNNDGIKESNESGIAGVTVTLTGTSDLGSPVNIVQATGADGSYQFTGLRPGTYTITKTPPANYLDGKDTLGSIGGLVGSNQFTGIPLGSSQVGTNYNFGEVLPSTPSGLVYADSYSLSSSSFDYPLSLQILSKLQFLSNSNSTTVSPTILAEATFVDGLYHAILDRAPDSPGLLNWVVAIQNGVSRAQIVDAIWSSAEHLGLEVDNLYQTFLNRNADPGGRAYWVNALASGASVFDVARAFINSGEYQTAHAANASFVMSLYADVLGRTASAQEVSGWVQLLQNGTSRDSVAVAFLTSGEAYTRMLNDDYEMYLHRNPDSIGEQGWLALLESGNVTPRQVGEGFLASNEYYADAVAASQGG
ncbi:MAG TPA: SdrD B-like domain-containing protein [Gemmataceae bacterium]|nr:SdrD B-like domain-containing protein [Gemmataceae bacterium]